MSDWDAVILNETDQVATALRQLMAGENAKVKSAQNIKLIIIGEDIPLCHKFAVQDISHGDTINKYGEVIGAASAEIKIGQHVHTHNLRSLRATKD